MGYMMQEQSMRLGISKVDITPSFPVQLAGFALRSELGAFESIAHRLFARIFVFATGGGEGESERKALLISADVLWWGSDRVPALKRRIHERYGIEEDA